MTHTYKNNHTTENNPEDTSEDEPADWCVIETKPGLQDWKRIIRTGLTKTDAKEYAKNRMKGPSGQAGYVYEATLESDQPELN